MYLCTCINMNRVRTVHLTYRLSAPPGWKSLLHPWCFPSESVIRRRGKPRMNCAQMSLQNGVRRCKLLPKSSRSRWSKWLSNSSFPVAIFLLKGCPAWQNISGLDKVASLCWVLLPGLGTLLLGQQHTLHNLPYTPLTLQMWQLSLSHQRIAHVAIEGNRIGTIQNWIL